MIYSLMMIAKVLWIKVFFYMSTRIITLAQEILRQKISFIRSKNPRSFFKGGKVFFFGYFIHNEKNNKIEKNNMR